MAASSSDDFLYNDDFEAVMAIIENDIVESDLELSEEMNSVVEKVPSKQSEQHHCQLCPKICMSKAGLSRHMKSKHQEALPAEQENSSNIHSLDMSTLQNFIVKSADKLSKDACYPDEIMEEFKNFKISSVDDVLPAYNLLSPILKSFKGEAEKFYPQYYKVFSTSPESVYRGLSGKCSLLLSFDVANQVLVHITGAEIQNDIVEFDCENTETFSEKDLSLLSYLGGYVFGTFYRRIHRKKNSSLYAQQCLSSLLAGKCIGGSITLPEHKHVNIMDRGGLWKVNENVTSIFKVAESYFKVATQKKVTKIDSKNIVSILMKNATVLHHASVIKGKSEEEIKKEVFLNLLEDLLTLYLRLRSFSYANDQQQAHKIQQTKVKARSLRTTLKQDKLSIPE